MDIVYVDKIAWKKFLKEKSKSSLMFAPMDSDGNLFYEKVNPQNISRIVYDRARPVDTLKIFLFPFKEQVVPSVKEVRPFVIMGPANCDLAGLNILDEVFLNGDFKDPNYKKRRENVLIISFDCQKPYGECFCELVGTHAYPEKNFDLNLTDLANGYVIEIGSEKGKSFLGEDSCFGKADRDILKRREEIRNRTVEKINEINKDTNLDNLQERLKTVCKTDIWSGIQDIKNCVGCGSCTANCPTCVCFLLEDTGNQEAFKKMKVWDSCLFPGYAQMASGATPRPALTDRFANRLLCKYLYMFENFGMVGCTGCGRCISGCIGKIDKRKVLKAALKDSPLDKKVPLEESSLF